ncbi:hypothetical protein KGQ20_31195, partial [Catenulispora sp. NF23]
RDPAGPPDPPGPTGVGPDTPGAGGAPEALCGSSSGFRRGEEPEDKGPGTTPGANTGASQADTSLG